MEGWRGWDDYARFYDWENAQTMGRRDVRFWQRLASRTAGQVLELGCGTGRVAIPVAKAGARVVGIDRSESMLARARKRVRRSKIQGSLALVRGDVRSLPFGAGDFALVAAPYGILQAAAITARLTQLFSLKVSNTIRYAHAPVPGFKDTDTTTSVALVAKF
jgi:ubiquinone/menaquinone biosynthesis C-methylase UbiE